MWPFKRRAPEPVRKVSRARVKPLAKRNTFNASLLDRLNHTWTTQAASADHVVFNNLATLRARAREQALNNDYVKRFTGMVKTNVIGPNGVAIQSRAIGLDGQPDKIAQKAIESAFNKWSRKENCDLKGRLTWVQMQNICITTIANDGEIFIREHTAGEYGYLVELIDPELVDVSYNDLLKNGNTVRFGIEYNKQGRAVAYHILQDGDGPNTYLANYNNKHYQRIPAKEIRHIFLPELIDQKRGLPWTATGLQRMKLLQGYEDAALVAARIGAAKMGFFTTEAGEEYKGDGVDAQGVPYEEADPGTFGILPEGVNFQSFDPDYPKGEFADFMKQALRGLAAGLSVSYNTLANDLEGVNFSSMRHGAVEERELWKCLQKWLIDELIEPIFNEWLERQHALGTIKIPMRNGTAKALSRELSNYTPAHFQGRRWDWVDPLKDIQAKKAEVELGVTSISAIIREKGGDVDEVREQLANDLAWLKENGLALFPEPPQQNNEAEKEGVEND